jgi:hypothetical protein
MARAFLGPGDAPHPKYTITLELEYGEEAILMALLNKEIADFKKLPRLTDPERLHKETLEQIRSALWEAHKPVPPSDSA